MDNNILFERLIIAAYRLPFKFTQTKSGIKAVQNSGGLVSAILTLSEKFMLIAGNGNEKKIIWTGIADDMSVDLPSAAFENEQFDIVPVGISPKLNDLHYAGFSNDLLWPLFHYFPSYCVYNNDYFVGYKEVNSRFCDEIIKVAKPGDFIWVHDYQLLLLPEMIRERLPGVTIGFFLHIPFPSFELFRLLPRYWRESIITGMLGADLIGFHTNDYTQHFIKCVKRTTIFECHQNIIYTPNKLVKADVFPIGIDYDKFHNACLNENVLAEKQKILKNLPGQKLIFSVDRLDYSKGLLLRLKGYETFLEKFPEWHTKVVYNMVVVPSRDSIEKYKEMKKEIESTVGRINGQYSSLAWRPIIYQYRSLSFNEMVALYDVSDVGLITPLRDGMNLVAKEYVACQVENKGVLILSEMAGAAAELDDALIINPVDHNLLAEAIHTALVMEPADKHARLERMQHRLATYNVFTWAYDFFHQAYDTKEHQRMLNVKFVNNPIASQITSEYHNAHSRILFLDYDGTLVAFSKYPELAVIDRKTINIIKKISQDPKNHIVIISGRNREFLERQFKGINVTLVAEHGYFIKRGNDLWEAAFDPDLHWKETVMPVLLEYVNRCNGTFVEEKTSSIAWHYRNADSDLAQRRLHELRDDLTEIIRNKPDFEIIDGNKVLELKSGRYDKGQAANALLLNESFDFILAAGDDKTDEFLFKALPETAYTIRIGLSPSLAKFNVAEFTIFLELLKALVS
ncbi:MAG: bifunctional alpha,alpha-trehalose-phosphate synthase (UDP-forming)/trehalose-phosphatase [Porphyromonadaceae bacterium]|nr:MAG: bifunctional alpha,alpha-trehalose-phosphate synthase (UDP-forming)/trehalose-phosphatase [Porphyromonadaceae bacterium]